MTEICLPCLVGSDEETATCERCRRRACSRHLDNHRFTCGCSFRPMDKDFNLPTFELAEDYDKAVLTLKYPDGVEWLCESCIKAIAKQNNRPDLIRHIGHR